MSDQLWVGLILILTWASLPLSLIVANAAFDKDVIKEGEEAGHH